MPNFYTLATATGQAKIAAALSSGVPVNLTQMAVGDGNGSDVTPTESMTALVRERYRAAITTLTTDPDNPNWLVAELVIPASVGGWTVREAGIFDADGALIAVANFPATYKPILADGSTRELVVRIILEVSDTAAVTLIVDPTVVLASRQWVIDNFRVAALLPGGTTGQILRKKSNTSGDVEWATAAATTEVPGWVELATDAEAQAGEDTTRAVTPASMAAVTATEARSGLLRIATDAEAQALADNLTAMTPAKLAAAFGGDNQNLILNGYQKLPGGLIVQWGTVTPTTVNTQYPVTLPIAYPTGCLAILTTRNNSGTSFYGSWGYIISPSQIAVASAATQSVFWLTIGH